MSSEQQIRAMALDSAVRWSVGSGETTENDKLCLESLVDTFSNIIAGYDIKAQAEKNNKAGRVNPVTRVITK